MPPGVGVVPQSCPQSEGGHLSTCDSPGRAASCTPRRRTPFLQGLLDRSPF